MKSYEKLILTYIGKYGQLDFSVLSRELSMPGRILLSVTEELYKQEYFEFEEEKVKLTDKGKRSAYEEWNTFTNVLEGEEELESEEFDWLTLYIPKDFKGA